MGGDLVARIFGDDPEPDPGFYPGSRKKLPARSSIEFIPDPWRENYTTKYLNGEEIRLYPIGALAEALGVSVPSIRLWTQHGIIPQAPYRLPSNMVVGGEKAAGRRLYTEEVIDAVSAIFEKYGLLGKRRIIWSDYPEVPIEITEAWSRIVQAPINKETR